MRVVRVPRSETVLTIFWTLAVVGPMFFKGVGVDPADPVFPLKTFRKESSDMKRALLMILVATVSAGLSGCRGVPGQGFSGLFGGSCAHAPGGCAPSVSGCDTCGEADCGGCGEAYGDSCGEVVDCGDACHNCGRRGCFGRCRPAIRPGPPTGAVTYPYYTLRAPRDFLARSPRTIGP